MKMFVINELGADWELDVISCQDDSGKNSYHFYEDERLPILSSNKFFVFMTSTIPIENAIERALSLIVTAEMMQDRVNSQVYKDYSLAQLKLLKDIDELFVSFR